MTDGNSERAKLDRQAEDMRERALQIDRHARCILYLDAAIAALADVSTFRPTTFPETTSRAALCEVRERLRKNMTDIAMEGVPR